MKPKERWREGNCDKGREDHGRWIVEPKPGMDGRERMKDGEKEKGRESGVLKRRGLAK